MLEKARQDNDAAKDEIKALRLEQQERLTQIAVQTRSLHNQQEKIDKVQDFLLSSFVFLTPMHIWQTLVSFTSVPLLN